MTKEEWRTIPEFKGYYEASNLGRIRSVERIVKRGKGYRTVPSVTPTQCIATVQFSKEDLREICNERIEIECTHGACKDCKFNVKSTKSTTMCDIGHRFYMREPSTFYCADFVKRGDLDGSN